MVMSIQIGIHYAAFLLFYLLVVVPKNANPICMRHVHAGYEDVLHDNLIDMHANSAARYLNT